MERDPYQRLPEDWRSPTKVFCAAWAYLMPAPDSLVMFLLIWIDEHKLTVEDIKPVYRGMVQPESLGKFEFQAQLMKAIGDAVAQRVESKRMDTKMKADRERNAKAKIEAEPVREKTLSDRVRETAERLAASKGIDT